MLNHFGDVVVGKISILKGGVIHAEVEGVVHVPFVLNILEIATFSA